MSRTGRNNHDNKSRNQVKVLSNKPRNDGQRKGSTLKRSSEGEPSERPVKSKLSLASRRIKKVSVIQSTPAVSIQQLGIQSRTSSRIGSPPHLQKPVEYSHLSGKYPYIYAKAQSTPKALADITNLNKTKAQTLRSRTSKSGAEPQTCAKKRANSMTHQTQNSSVDQIPKHKTSTNNYQTIQINSWAANPKHHGSQSDKVTLERSTQSSKKQPSHIKSEEKVSDQYNTTSYHIRRCRKYRGKVTVSAKKPDRNEQNTPLNPSQLEPDCHQHNHRRTYAEFERDCHNSPDSLSLIL